MGRGDEAANETNLRTERDLYLRLLELGHYTEIEVVLREGLRLILEVTGARQGHLQLLDEGGALSDPSWVVSRGLSAEDLDNLGHSLRDPHVVRTLDDGKLVVGGKTRADLGNDMGSADTTLLAPIGENPARGVLYLRASANGGSFSARGRRLAEEFTRHLASVTHRVLARRDTHSLVEDATSPLRQTLQVQDVIGRSPALAAVLHQIALASPLDVTVLLTGDSGTGKSQLARVLHRNSPRARLPFVEVSCGTLPDSLFENELFGAMPGAHSTALHRVTGKVAAAEGGTLFLDEVGNLSPAAQSKLLQLLQSKEYYALGSSKPLRADVRVIAATNTDLRHAVDENRFRTDLYYRLHVLPVHVPSLDERREDIPELVAHFCVEARRRHGLPELPIAHAALRAVQVAAWPGNVRQLAHATEVACIRASADGCSQVEVGHFFPTRNGVLVVDEGPLTLFEATRRFQRDLLLSTLRETDWNVLETARRLDITRSHVYNLMRSFGLDRRSNG